MVDNHDFVPDYEDVEYGAHQYHLEQSTNGSVSGYQDQLIGNELGKK
jgi:hypothetical protein